MSDANDTMTAFIFARGGSKGLPGKNIKPLAGKPLIAWAIEAALGVPEIGRVVVSTDDANIARVGRAYGADVPFMRPSELASDTAPEWLSWRHALHSIEEAEGKLYGPLISVPATAPLRLPEDISACINLYNEGGADVVLAITESHRNPWFNMVAKREDDTFSPVNSSEGKLTRRQDAPSVFDVTTVAYVANPKFVLEQMSLFDGRVKAILVPVERSIDIDTSHDFAIAEFLMTKRLGQK